MRTHTHTHTKQAGGKGTTGYQRMLEVMPEKVHQREPLFIGSPKEVSVLDLHLKHARRLRHVLILASCS